MKKVTQTAVLLLSAALTISAIPAGTCVAWSSDPAINTAISTAFDHQNNHQGAPDGSGGAIVTWQDYRARYGTMSDIYTQRIDSKGKTLWLLDGVIVSTAPNDQVSPQIVSDGNGGAIIMWVDSRNGNLDIYAQRLDANGTPLWQKDGVAICTNASTQEYPQMISDGAGGAIISWDDHRNGNVAIFAQRVDGSGNVLWLADGVAVSDPSPGHYHHMMSDGVGGAVIGWSYGVYDGIRAQRIDSSGQLLWAMGGVVISKDAAAPQGLRMACDSNGGTIMVWQDDRNGYDTSDIYAQRIDAEGKVKWPSDVAVRIAVYRQQDPQITSDGVGGAIISWLDAGNGYIYAQRISGNGTLPWKAGGVRVSSAPSYQQNPEIVGDGKGGTIITWEDYAGVYHIYAQKLSRNGKVMWLQDGVVISTASGNQRGPKLVSDGQGGAIIAFVNNIDGMTDLFAQKVSAKGQLQPVQVFSPNGGERISSGSIGETIEWGAPADAVSFTLLYSVNNGLAWKTIDQGVIGTTYPWNVPLLTANNTKCKIKVVGYTASNVKVGEDVSDAPFTIEVLTITYPQNESTCTSGQTCTITWGKAPALNAQTGQLSYSINGGLTWKVITNAITGTDTSYGWTPTELATKTNCKVRLIYKDATGKKVATAASGGKFSIVVP